MTRIIDHQRNTLPVALIWNLFTMVWFYQLASLSSHFSASLRNEIFFFTPRRKKYIDQVMFILLHLGMQQLIPCVLNETQFNVHIWRLYFRLKIWKNDNMTDIYINLISYLLSCLSILKMNINVIMTVIKLLLFFLNSVVKWFILKYPPPPIIHW